MLWEWGGKTIIPHPHAHPTPLLTSLWRKNLHALSNSRPHNFLLFISTHYLHFLLLFMHRLWVVLVSCRHFFLAPQVAEHPRTAISRPPCCLVIHGKKRSCFLLTQGLHCCAFSRRGIPFRFLPSCAGIFGFFHIVLSPAELWMLWLYFSLTN